MPDEGFQQTLGNVEPVEIQEEMERSFLDYAMSVITARALPDARDGLKPVHRRILYGMYERGLRPDRKHQKSAQAVGDVMGRYHPHGDQAIYDALARMAQDFSLRYPLIDGHGNFGSPDPADKAASMRYCVTGDTRIRTVDGTVAIADLAEAEPNSDVDLDVKVLNYEGRPVLASKLFHSGTHPTLRLRTTEGFELTGTRNHPVLCLERIAGVPVLQWRLLEELRAGDRVVIARHEPEPTAQEPDERERRLGLLAAASVRSAQKRVPSFVWRASAETTRVFLQALFEGDGSVSQLRSGTIQVWCSTRSERLADEVQQLLLELGVLGRQARAANGEIKVLLSSRRDVRRFSSLVGFLGAKQRRLEQLLESVPRSRGDITRDRIPFVAEYLRTEGSDRWPRTNGVDSLDRWEREGSAISSRLSGEARAVVGPLAQLGFHYATVASVDDAGTKPVYSIKVETDCHSFVSNGFVSHNTEARLAPLAMELIGEIDEDTVDFTATYDGQNQEPAVLPARFPNLLVNGVGGIAVGMATNIPPHNLREIIDAAIYVLDHPDASAIDLMKIVKGPDFPTGALILGQEGIRDAYTTGRGSIKMRAVAEIEEGRRGDQRIVVSAVPYQTSVEVIGQKVAELVNDRRIEGIRDVRNESAGDTTRLVVELRHEANANVVLNQLYKHTPMQTNFPVHMLALVEGVPRLLTLDQAMLVYVAHQMEVVTRRTEYRLRKARDRAHIVEGLVRALDMLDAVIELIRGSADVETARAGLMAAPFEFSEIQANHILDMPLRRLTALERQKLVDELEELRATIAELESILQSKPKLRAVIKEELTALRDKYGDDRRTTLTIDTGEIDVLDLIEDEEVVVVLTKKGYIKTVPADAFRRQARGGRGVRGSRARDDDYVDQLLITTAHSYLLLFSNRGRVYRMRAHEIPMKERTARGTAIVNLIPLAPDERVQTVIDTRTYEDGAFLLFATRKGVVKKTRMTEYDSTVRNGLIAINLSKDDELVRVVQTTGDDDLIMVSRDGQTIRFAESDVRAMGRAAGGVRGMRLRPDDAVVGCDVIRPGAVMLFVSSSGHGKRTRLDRFSRQRRGGQGVRGMKITASRGGLVAAFTVSDEDEILVFSSSGNIIRMGAKEISVQGRDATGVRVARLAAGETIVAVAPVLEGEGGEDAEQA